MSFLNQNKMNFAYRFESNQHDDMLESYDDFEYGEAEEEEEDNDEDEYEDFYDRILKQNSIKNQEINEDDYEPENHNADLDIDNLKNEFQNKYLMNDTHSLIQNSNQFYLPNFNQQNNTVLLTPIINLTNCENSQDSQTIKISDDDLIDRNDQLKSIYLKEFFDKYECVVDQSQGIFALKNSKLSKSLQRKLINLHQLLTQNCLNSNELINPSSTVSQIDLLNLVVNAVNTKDPNSIIKNSIQNQEYKKKVFRLLRSISERVLIDALALCDQLNNQIQVQELLFNGHNNNNNYSNLNSTSSSISTSSNLNNPTSKLWCEIRNRGCQFLGPQMQDDVLRLILHALETVTRMSRKVLVLYVVHMLKKHYPKASKTSVGHVVQLLYRAGCFKVEKRDNDSSLMELRKEFSKYPALRKQHDMQIIQIALESGIRMSPEQWSQKLFGDSTHKSEMQSIIDKLQSQQTLEKLIHDFFDKIQQGSYLSNLSNPNELVINSLFLKCKHNFDFFSSINFEKKQTNNVTQNENLNIKKRNSIASVGSATNTNCIGSGAESLTSDDDLSFEHNDYFNYSDELNDLNEDSDLSSQKNKNLNQQKEQTKIVWSLLIECLKRVIQILRTHMEYSSKMMSIIISNQNSSNHNTSNSIKVNNKSSINLNQLNGLSPSPPQLNITFNSAKNSNQGFLLSMGPNKYQNQTNNRPILNRNNHNNNTNNINSINKNNLVQNNNNNNNNKYFNISNNKGFVKNSLKNINNNNNSNSEESCYLNKNQFGFTNYNKIWSDDNKNRFNLNHKTSINNNGNTNEFNHVDTRNFKDNIYQNNFFDSKSLMMLQTAEQDQQFYPSMNRQESQQLKFIKSNLIQNNNNNNSNNQNVKNSMYKF